MAGLVVVLMRGHSVRTADERIQKAVARLKREQPFSGRGWMNALYKPNFIFITDMATAQATMAFALLDLLPSIEGGS